MEAIAEKIGREPEFQDTSFDTIFRDLAQGKFDSGRLGGDDHRRTREDGRLHQPVLPAVGTGDPGHRRDSDIELGRGPRRARSSAPSRERPARNTSKKKPTPSELRAFPQGPDAITALKAGTVDAVVIDQPGRRKRGRSRTAASKSPAAIPTEEAVWIRGRSRATTNCSTNSTKALEEVNDDGDIHDDLQEVVPQADAAGNRSTATHEPTERPDETAEQADLRRGAAAAPLLRIGRTGPTIRRERDERDSSTSTSTLGMMSRHFDEVLDGFCDHARTLDHRRRPRACSGAWSWRCCASCPGRALLPVRCLTIAYIDVFRGDPAADRDPADLGQPRRSVDRVPAGSRSRSRTGSASPTRSGTA